MRKILLIFLLVLLAGCTSDVVQNSVRSWLVYENPEIGIKFTYPDYYSTPELSLIEGQAGQAFNLRFIADYVADDPYIIDIHGASLDFEPKNPLADGFYIGNLSSDQFCAIDKAPIKSYLAGSVCKKVELVNNVNGAIYNLASIAGNAVEKVFFANFPSSNKYTGLQIGLKIPYKFLKYSMFASADIRGDKAVSDLLSRMDDNKLPSDLLDELDRFNVVLQSFEFLNK